jgi:hypothetical protein
MSPSATKVHTLADQRSRWSYSIIPLFGLYISMGSLRMPAKPYLQVSVEAQVDPRSLACMLAAAIRAAQRMGMHSESSNNSSDCTTLEAEMRRRLWWSLVLFDHRVCEIVCQEKSTTTLYPAWDCRPPLNVNDFEMQPDTRMAPTKHDTSATEALFVVVRSELADFVRNSVFHLNFVVGQPSSERISQSKRDGGELKVLGKLIEDKHLVYCNEEVPLHYMTIWTTRSSLARSRLLEHYLTHSPSSSVRPTDAERSAAFSYALRMIECDTQLRTSRLTKGYLWLVDSYYPPILAYFHILNGLARRPAEELAKEAWSTMANNYEALVAGPKHHRTRLVFATKFPRTILQAWEAREALLTQQRVPPEIPPRLVLDAKAKMTQMNSSLPSAPSGSWESPTGVNASASSTTVVAPTFSTSPDLGGNQTSGGAIYFAAPFSGGQYFDLSNQGMLNTAQSWSEGVSRWPEL